MINKHLKIISRHLSKRVSFKTSKNNNPIVNIPEKEMEIEEAETYTAMKRVHWMTFNQEQYCKVFELESGYLDDLQQTFTLKYRQIPLYYLVLMGVTQSFDQVIHYPLLAIAYSFYRIKRKQFTEQIKEKTVNELQLSQNRDSILISTSCEKTNDKLHKAFPSSSSLIRIPTKQILKYSFIKPHLNRLDQSVDVEEERKRIDSLRKKEEKQVGEIFKGYDEIEVEGKNMLELDKTSILLEIGNSEEQTYFQLIVNLGRNNLSGHNDVLIALALHSPFNYPN